MRQVSKGMRRATGRPAGFDNLDKVTATLATWPWGHSSEVPGVGSLAELSLPLSIPWRSRIR